MKDGLITTDKDGLPNIHEPSDLAEYLRAKDALWANDETPVHLRVERGPDSMLGQAQPPGLPTKFIFQAPAKLWFDRRPSFNYRIVAIEIEEVR